MKRLFYFLFCIAFISAFTPGLVSCSDKDEPLIIEDSPSEDPEEEDNSEAEDPEEETDPEESEEEENSDPQEGDEESENEEVEETPEIPEEIDPELENLSLLEFNKNYLVSIENSFKLYSETSDNPLKKYFDLVITFGSNNYLAINNATNEYKVNVDGSRPNITIEFTPEGFISCMQQVIWDGNLGSSTSTTIQDITTYNFRYNNNGNLLYWEIERKKIRETYRRDTEERTTSTDILKFESRYLKWTNGNLSNIDYANVGKILYGSEKNNFKQYTCLLSHLITEDELIRVCLQMGLLGNGPSNIPVGLQSKSSNKPMMDNEFNFEFCNFKGVPVLKKESIGNNGYYYNYRNNY